MATAQNSMQPLFKKLQACGFNSAFVKKMLPDWWDDSIADTPSGLQQATLILGQLLAIRPDSLWSPTGSPVFALPESRKFKRRSDIDTESLDVACALAFSAARIVQNGLKNKLPADSYAPTLPTAQALRQMLLAKSKWVGLPELLGYCFSIGIPVIYLHQFPNNAKKMAGLAFDCQGHPVIVLTNRSTHGSLLFDLAHELGHIALNHLTPGGCIIDQEIDADAKEDDERAANDKEDDERAANDYALALLTGKVAGRIDGNQKLTAYQLANEALKLGRIHQIDPTHVVLNYGHTKQQWPVAMAAIKQIVGRAPSDQEMMREMLFSNLDQGAMKDDDLVTLAWLVGKDSE